MNAKRARFAWVFVTLLAAPSAGFCSARVIAQAAWAEGSTFTDGVEVPPLEPSFAVRDVPEPTTARPSVPRSSSAPTVESDVDHVARLMAGHLHCGDTYANDVGGRNAECRVAIGE
jgi:hypothetical protein